MTLVCPCCQNIISGCPAPSAPTATTSLHNLLVLTMCIRMQKLPSIQPACLLTLQRHVIFLTRQSSDSHPGHQSVAVTTDHAVPCAVVCGQDPAGQAIGGYTTQSLAAGKKYCKCGGQAGGGQAPRQALRSIAAGGAHNVYNVDWKCTERNNRMRRASSMTLTHGVSE